MIKGITNYCYTLFFTILNDSLGGLEFNVSDNKPQWREVGADTWNFFSSGENTFISLTKWQENGAWNHTGMSVEDGKVNYAYGSTMTLSNRYLSVSVSSSKYKITALKSGTYIFGKALNTGKTGEFTLEEITVNANDVIYQDSSTNTAYNWYICFPK